MSAQVTPSPTAVTATAATASAANAASAVPETATGRARPTLPQLRAQLARERRRTRTRRLARRAGGILAVVAAVTILVATLALPVLQISGSSMTPTLAEGQVVVAAKVPTLATGDIVAVNYGNRVLVKRVIATAGDWVDVAADGTVYVNGAALAEPYLTEKSLGKCDISLPYQVPEDSYFVMGDHRETSVDSRSSSVGAVPASDIEGKIFLRIWPISGLGWI
jgi:signal peptidase I